MRGIGCDDVRSTRLDAVEPTRGGNKEQALFRALSEAADMAAIVGVLRLFPECIGVSV